MGFIIGTIVNFILLSIPIGASLGTLLAIRPFRGDRESPKVDLNGFVTTALCNPFHQFAQNKNGQNFTVNSNEVLPEDGSKLCMTMVTFENNTYATNGTAPDVSFTWSYPFTIANASVEANETQALIHAFPQVAIENSGEATVPITLEDLGSLVLDFQWFMGIGDDLPPATSFRRLGAQEVNASVALDMYIDPDKTAATDAGKAGFEMIIFFAKWGLFNPVGFGNGTVVTTTTLNGTEFDLFAGQNAAEQNVFSWLAKTEVDEFYGDISPLFDAVLQLEKITQNGDVIDMPKFGFNDFLGYVGFGTQAYNAIGDVTFSVPRLHIDVQPFGS